MKKDTQDMPLEQALEITESLFSAFIEKRLVGGDYEERALATIKAALQQKPAVLEGERKRALELADKLVLSLIKDTVKIDEGLNFSGHELTMLKALAGWYIIHEETIKSALQSTTVKENLTVESSAVEAVTVEEFKKLRLAANHETAMNGDPFDADAWQAKSFPNGLKIISDGTGE